ncbi:DNA polymerase ligase N-terminal domain-containing protein [Mumia sp. DW29H23]|uniref:DNA polymerase ligase N-terminal domain-containing protein n=1 Tax=Mumia sp. DW29H23 TaxID=3421241 RepID=UPI003D682D3C
MCQRHNARALHFDLRLEIDGVLVSWAVPKGPSPDPAQKRLAVRTDDHDLAHASYEGAYGRGGGKVGSVVVWDRGTFERRPPRPGEPHDTGAALAAGHLVVDLHGDKLEGPYALTRTGPAGPKEQWILVKMRGRGSHTGAEPAEEDLASVLSGLTNDDLERAWRG